jgi:hypothetical protein
MTNSIVSATAQSPESPFDSIRRYDQKGNEYWLARELQKLLGYIQWRRFDEAIERAKISAEIQELDITKHLAEVGKLGTLATLTNPRNAQDYKLSRYFCYLIALNGDPRKSEIAQAQGYFVVKTQQAEATSIQSQVVPSTFREALLLAVKQQEEIERLEIEKEMLKDENHLLAEAVDDLFSYSSIVRIAKFNNCDETIFKWRSLKTASIQVGSEIRKVPCPRFEYKNLYSHDAWRLAYPDVQLPETTTLLVQR